MKDKIMYGKLTNKIDITSNNYMEDKDILLLIDGKELNKKLFININEKDTPFSLENVTFVKKIALYNALLVISSDILGTIAGYIFYITLNVDIDIKNYLFVLVIIALSYIFKYGYEIQLDSNGKIYGKNNK